MLQENAIETDQLHLSHLGQEVFFSSLLKVLASSSDLSPAVPAAQQQQQQQEESQQQQQQQGSAQQQLQQQQLQQLSYAPDSQDMPQGSQAIKMWSFVIMGLLFLAIVTEVKQQAQCMKKEDL
jgi:hypothetical protein